MDGICNKKTQNAISPLTISLLYIWHPKTQVGYSQRTNTLVKTCNISQNLCAEPVTIASFWIPLNCNGAVWAVALCEHFTLDSW